MVEYQYRGYSIVSEGHGFYRVLDLRGELVRTCEGAATAREIVDEHINRVYSFYNINCDLSPLQLRAARKLNITQAEFVIEHGRPEVQQAHDGLSQWERDEIERLNNEDENV